MFKYEILFSPSNGVQTIKSIAKKSLILGGLALFVYLIVSFYGFVFGFYLFEFIDNFLNDNSFSLFQESNSDPSVIITLIYWVYSELYIDLILLLGLPVLGLCVFVATTNYLIRLIIGEFVERGYNFSLYFTTITFFIIVGSIVAIGILGWANTSIVFEMLMGIFTIFAVALTLILIEFYRFKRRMDK